MSGEAPGCAHCDEWLVEYAYGELEASRRALVDRHLGLCARCREQLDAMARTRRAMAALAPEPEPRPGLESLLAYAAQTAARQRQAAAPRRRGRWFLTAVPLGTMLAAILLVVTRSHDPSRILATPREQAPAVDLRAPAAPASAHGVAEDSAATESRLAHSAGLPEAATKAAALDASKQKQAVAPRPSAQTPGEGARGAANTTSSSAARSSATVVAAPMAAPVAAAKSEEPPRHVRKAGPDAPAARKKSFIDFTEKPSNGAVGLLGAGAPPADLAPLGPRPPPARAPEPPAEEAQANAPAPMVLKLEKRLAVAAPARVEELAPQEADSFAETGPSGASAAPLLLAARERAGRGDTEGALKLLDVLLVRHPDDPLAPAAALERVRLLRALGRGEEAARAADALRRRFPNSEQAKTLPAAPDRPTAGRPGEHP